MSKNNMKSLRPQNLVVAMLLFVAAGGSQAALITQNIDYNTRFVNTHSGGNNNFYVETCNV